MAEQTGIDWAGLSDEAVVDLTAAFIREASDNSRKAAQGKAEILRRCEFRGGTALKSEQHTASLKRGSPTYDIQKLQPLREMLTASDLAEVLTESYERVTVVPEMWHGTKLNKFEKQYGGAIADRIQDARMLGEYRVDIQETK